MARSTAALAVASLALLVVLAGCSAIVGTDGPPGTTVPGGTAEPPPTGTVTDPAPTPDATTSEPPDSLLPGLTREGVVDATLLADAHRDGLRNTSYTLFYEAHAGENAAVDTSPTVVATFGADPGRFRWRLDSLTPSGDRGLLLRAWANGSRLHRQLTQGGNTTVDVVDGSPASLDSADYLFLRPTRDRLLYRLYVAFDVDEVRSVETDDGSRYRLVATSVDQPAALDDRPGARVSNASLTATLDADGVVRRLRVRYDVERDGDTRRVGYDLRVTGVGATTVERPEWVNASATPAGAGP